MRVQEMKKKVIDGEIPSLNRSKDEILRKKAAKGGACAATWYLKGQTSRVVKCQPTPGGLLTKNLKKALNPDGCKERTHVMEEGGLPVTVGLRVNDPFHPGSCRYGDPKCIVEQNKDCGLMGNIYEITCNSCQEAVIQEQGEQCSRQPGGQMGPNYIGMTATSAHCRMKAHLKGQLSKKEVNPLFRHDRDHHGGHKQEYRMRILTREQRILPLSVMEALYIESQSPGTTINEKNEFGRGKLVRIVASRGVD